MIAPRPPLPDDLQHRLDIILARPSLNRFPRLCEAIIALVQDAFGRQPVPETLAAMQRQLAEAGLSVTGRRRGPPALQHLLPELGFPAADLYDHKPEHLQPVLEAYDEDIPGAGTHRGRMRQALDKARELCEAAGRVGELHRGMPVSYGAPSVIQSGSVVAAPVVALWPDGTISSGHARMDRAGAEQLVRLLQLALRDQAALQG